MASRCAGDLPSPLRATTSAHRQARSCQPGRISSSTAFPIAAPAATSTGTATRSTGQPTASATVVMNVCTRLGRTSSGKVRVFTSAVGVGASSGAISSSPAGAAEAAEAAEAAGGRAGRWPLWPLWPLRPGV